GTHLVADIQPGSQGSNPKNLLSMNGILYFTANDGADGRELWQTDGTADGTVLIQDINPGRGSAFHTFHNPWLTAVNGQLCFSADDRVSGRELWVYTPDSQPSLSPAKGSPRPVPVSAIPEAAAGEAAPRSARSDAREAPQTLPPSLLASPPAAGQPSGRR